MSGGAPPAGDTSKRAEIIAEFERRGVRRQDACLYADAFLEYQEASANIDKNGAIVLHPRNGSPMKNPYLEIRAAAFARLQKMQNVEAGWLW